MERKELLKTVQEFLVGLDEDERKDFVDACIRGYCKHCLSNFLPCYCCNDD